MKVSFTAAGSLMGRLCWALIFSCICSFAEGGENAAANAGLAAASPFLSAATGNPTDAEGISALELRGICGLGGNRFLFCIHDRQTKRSEWVGLAEAGRPYVVQSYKADADSVEVEHAGKKFTLELPMARVRSAKNQDGTAAVFTLRDGVAERVIFPPAREPSRFEQPRAGRR